MTSVNYWVVIPAAGTGSRMQSDTPKQYLQLAGKPVLQHALECFLQHPRIRAVVVVLAADDPYWPALSIASHDRVMTSTGGSERCHSVLNGLKTLADVAAGNDWVLVHDAARPCLTGADLDRLLDTVGDHAVGGILAAPVRDTMKRGGADHEIAATVDRRDLWHAMTPQMFRYEKLLKALSTALENHEMVTDEAQAMEMTGVKPLLVEGHISNIKITQMGDLDVAKFYLQRRE